jgi:lipoprotein-anchoring transpeptidase ErfK/SrfK
MSLTRRGFLIGLPLLLAACSTRTTPIATQLSSASLAYAAMPNELHPLPALNVNMIRPELRRTEIEYTGTHAKGTVVVDTPAKYLYYVMGEGRAMRYGIGVGREGLALRGNAYIGRKAQWPGWTPTANMLRRDPELNGPYRNGVPGGLDNPLGARALYLYRNGRDTMFRIHGTNQPQSIGLAMSSGCVRMLNHDVIDLYERVPSGARVVVIQA